jgi:hypothetical protein
LKLKLLKIALKQSSVMKTMTDDLHTLAKCCNDLKPGGTEDHLLREILFTFLSLGRAMSLPYREEASGFCFSSLKNIDAVKSSLHEDYNLRHHGCVVWLQKHVEEKGARPADVRQDVKKLVTLIETIQNAYNPYSTNTVFSRLWKVEFDSVVRDVVSVTESESNHSEGAPSKLLTVMNFFVGLMKPSIRKLLDLQFVTKKACTEIEKYVRVGWRDGNFAEGRIFEDFGEILKLLKFAASDTCEKASFCIEIATKHLRENANLCVNQKGELSKEGSQKRLSFNADEILSNASFQERLTAIRGYHEKSQTPVVSSLVVDESEKPSREDFEKRQRALLESLGSKWTADSTNQCVDDETHLLTPGIASVTPEKDCSSSCIERGDISDDDDEGISNVVLHPTEGRPDQLSSALLELKIDGKSMPDQKSPRQSRVLGTFGGKILTVAEHSEDGKSLKRWNWDPSYKNTSDSGGCIWEAVLPSTWKELGANHMSMLEVMFSTGSSQMTHSTMLQETQKYFTMHDYHNIETKSKSKLGCILENFLKQVPKELVAKRTAHVSNIHPSSPTRNDPGGESTTGHEGGAQNSATSKFSLGELKSMLERESKVATIFADHGMQRSALEDYLIEIDFEHTFNMSYVEFKQLPKWKQADLKKQAQLF